MMTTIFKNSDLRNSVVLGLIIALFLLFVMTNLKGEIPIPSFLSGSKWLLIVITPTLVTLWIYLTFNLGTRWPVFFQFGKFVTIGLSNTAIDFGLLNLFMYLSHIERGLFFSLFKGFSFLVAVSNSFIWNKFWTFDNNYREELGKQLIKFLVISGVAFIINVTVASLIVNVMGPIGKFSPPLWANIGAFASLGITLLWTFLGYKFIVFK
jgi:putative flippase GtrA